MGDGGMTLLHTGISTALIIVLITVVRINPAIVLVIGAVYLGIATGLGFDKTMETVATGFGDLMAEVGIILGFGILLGSLMQATGAIERIVDALLKVFRRGGTPYALSLSTTTVFPAIYFDVTLVILGSLARSTAARSGLRIASLGGALAAGLEVGLLFVPPGVAALGLAGTLDVPVGTMLLFGLGIGIPTAALTTFLYTWLVNHGFWNKDKDEAEFHEDVADQHDHSDGKAAEQVRNESTAESQTEATRTQRPSLFTSLLPVLVPLALIVLATITDAAGVDLAVIAFLGNPIVALLLGVLVAYALASRTLSRDAIEDAIGEGLKTSGLLLLFTGVAGSLGAVIAETGVKEVIEGAFSATAFSPLLLVWLVAALLRIAQGSATVAAIAGASIVAPIVADLGITPVLVALAAGSGAAFGAHVSDNSFWVYRALLGVSVRGTFKSYTLCQSLVSVISLVLVLALSVVV